MLHRLQTNLCTRQLDQFELKCVELVGFGVGLVEFTIEYWALTMSWALTLNCTQS